jgi:hypothetical protein
MGIVKAETVFNAGSGFSEEEIGRVMAAGAGRTISFRRVQSPESRVQSAEVAERMLTEFARGKTADEVAKKNGMSRRQVFYALKRERAEGLNAERLKSWQDRGLSLREIGRLYGKSHEAVRQAMGQETGTNTGTE